MSRPAPESMPRQARLSQALRALRRRRGVGAADLAAALGMPLRSYQHFEAGRSRLNLDRVHAVARQLDADPYAILAAVDLGSPDLAVRAADNKLMTIIVMALKDFDERLGDRILQLDARILTTVFERAFNELATVAEERAAAASRWTVPPRPPSG